MLKGKKNEYLFWRKLKKLRQGKNLAQEKLADFPGISFQTVSKWERGDNHPDITMLSEMQNLFLLEVYHSDAIITDLTVSNNF